MGAYDDFIQTVWAYYREHGRHDLPWRLPEPDGSFDPYKILVSEVMLQQTQVPRVIPKYEAFLRRFPTLRSLADVPLGDVLVAWQGLGYNRRAKYLWQSARVVMGDYHGIFPKDIDGLSKLPGIGRNTAGAILVYACNEPVVFIETNIRTVFIHHFFKDHRDVSDKEILEVLRDVLLALGKSSAGSPSGEVGFIPTGAYEKPEPEGPQALAWGSAWVSYREWYWALMDYGAYVKQSIGNVSRNSKAYAKQSRFAGSERQLRGRVLRLLAQKPLDEAELLAELNDPRAAKVISQLEQEGMIVRDVGQYRLP